MAPTTTETGNRQENSRRTQREILLGGRLGRANGVTTCTAPAGESGIEIRFEGSVPC